ncbi:putative F-box/FBD/LRR-repeat protein At4g03220 [Bidens hawaiensis]|uniref:putative F-box/FBD/LRR-repeat protein At4g03220 n=1 Tax=Bidens hawaiensis TaxID=980011 RepID=UPI004049E2E5
MTLADRLSNMPESLRLRILSCLDSRQAVRTLVLSKSWLSTWTCIPVLNFTSYGFDYFVINALSGRQSVKLDKLTFKHVGDCGDEISQLVFDYAFSQGVEELEASIQNIKSWPTGSSDTLTSLKFTKIGSISAGYTFLELRSAGSFKNLTSLYLRSVTIGDLDPFSGFPALNKLRLDFCPLATEGNALNVHAPQLSKFTIFYGREQSVRRCEFTTPKLKHFDWQGSEIPHLMGSFPFLQAVFVKYIGRRHQEKASIQDIKSWSSDSITSLKFMKSGSIIAGRTFLEPRSVGTFKNLTNLYLQNVTIGDPDPFSGFPALEKLQLDVCPLTTEDNALNVHAPQLSEFTIFYNRGQSVRRCEFTTPKLKYFYWNGRDIPHLTGGFPVLETVSIDYNGYCRQEKERMMFDDLLMLFNSLRNARSLDLSSPVVHLLTLFPLNGSSPPFPKLKCLKLHLESFRNPHLFFQRPCRLLTELLELVPGLKAYLLPRSPDSFFGVWVRNKPGEVVRRLP